MCVYYCFIERNQDDDDDDDEKIFRIERERIKLAYLRFKNRGKFRGRSFNNWIIFSTVKQQQQNKKICK